MVVARSRRRELASSLVTVRTNLFDKPAKHRAFELVRVEWTTPVFSPSLTSQESRAPDSSAALLAASAGGLRFGGEMLLKIALGLLAVWLVGVLGVYDIGDAVHIFFLVGGMLLLLGVLKARDAAIAASRKPEEPSGRR